jgi:hypothetical protein
MRLLRKLQLRFPLSNNLRIPVQTIQQQQQGLRNRTETYLLSVRQLLYCLAELS